MLPSAAHPQPQRSGVRLQNTPDSRRGFLPAPAALHPVTLPAGAAGLHRLDPRHRSSDRSARSHALRCRRKNKINAASIAFSLVCRHPTVERLGSAGPLEDVFRVQKHPVGGG